MLLHLRKDRGFRSGFVWCFGVFLHGLEDNTVS
jgi:hypothetical protein